MGPSWSRTLTFGVYLLLYRGILGMQCHVSVSDDLHILAMVYYSVMDHALLSGCGFQQTLRVVLLWVLIKLLQPCRREIISFGDFW